MLALFPFKPPKLRKPRLSNSNYIGMYSRFFPDGLRCPCCEQSEFGKPSSAAQQRQLWCCVYRSNGSHHSLSLEREFGTGRGYPTQSNWAVILCCRSEQPSRHDSCWWNLHFECAIQSGCRRDGDGAVDCRQQLFDIRNASDQLERHRHDWHRLGSVERAILQ
jgi:hypothetical protein